MHRLLQIKPDLEAMVENGDASPLVMAIEQHGNIHKYAAASLRTLTFRSRRRNDPLLAAVATLKMLYAEARDMMDFHFQRLAWSARFGKLGGVRMESDILIVTPNASEIPAEADALNAEISEMYPLVELPDLLREVHE